MRLLFDKIPFSLTDEQALSQLKLDEDFLDELAPRIARTRETARPRVVIQSLEITAKDETSVLANGVEIKSRVVANQLSACKTAYAYVGTCGREADALMQETDDAVEQLWQAQLNQHIMKQGVAWAMSQLQEQEQLPSLSAVNPGSNPDWPITQQPLLFDLIGNVERDVGVTLTQSCLMLPIKSVSGIWYVSKEHYTNCQICRRTSCQGRRAPFDQEKFESIFGVEM